MKFLLDFLFPKSRRTLELETLEPHRLVEILPQAGRIARKDTLALFDYSNSLVRDLIWELKYKGNRVVAEKLGQVLYDTLVEEASERALLEHFDQPLLVPLPISDKRRFERGWNQAELICEAVRRADRNGYFKYLPRQLVKRVHTESQTKTTGKSERLHNLENTMRVLNEKIFDRKCVVLVDDVTTTGATFQEARRALGAAGARKILCVALAH